MNKALKESGKQLNTDLLRGPYTSDHPTTAAHRTASYLLESTTLLVTALQERPRFEHT